MYSDTCHNYAVLVGAFWGQFGAIEANLGPSDVPEQDIEANFGWISSLSSAQKRPEYSKIMYSVTNYNHTVLVVTSGDCLGANLGKFGPFEGLRAR